MVKPSNVTFNPIFHCNAHACIEIMYLNGRICQWRHNNNQAECCVCHLINHLIVALFPESHMETISTFVFRAYMLSDKCNAPDKLHNNSSSQVHHTKQILHSSTFTPSSKILQLGKSWQGTDKNTRNVNVFLGFVHFSVRELLLLFFSTVPHWW